MIGHDALPLYVVGALPEDERLAFEAHLQSCVRCQQELVDHGQALDELASAVETLPDDGLRATVLDAAAVTPQETVTADRAAPAGVTAPSDASADPRSVGSRSFAIAAALLALALVAATTTAALLWVRVGDLEQLTAGQPAAVADVLTAADSRLVALDSELDGTLRLVVDPTSGRAIVLGDGVQQPPSDRAYQLWLLDDDASPRSGGVLAGGDGVLTTVTDVGDANAVAITVEPPSGSQTPTGPIVAQGAFADGTPQD